jgi:hypothetical protein
MFVSFCLSVFYELAAKHPVMSKGLLLAKHEDPKDRSVARIISIQFIPAKKKRETETTTHTQHEIILFYTKPIFRARKYELF